jgi:hypothetical protein
MVGHSREGDVGNVVLTENGMGSKRQSCPPQTAPFRSGHSRLETHANSFRAFIEAFM